MNTYQLEVKAYEFEEWDEEEERLIPGTIAGYTVFSTIRIGAYTIVRAVVENTTGQPVHAKTRAWFVEWKVTCGVSNATQRMTGKLTRAKALAEGERLARLIAPHTFADLSEVEAFYAANRPTVRTYGA